MNTVFSLLLFAALAQATTPGIHNLTIDVPEVGSIRYAVSVPRGYNPRQPVPLVLVLHPGGERIRYYGSSFTRLVVEPALNDLQAIMIAPDCPAGSWSDPIADRAVLALLEQTFAAYAIDRRRVLVTGFSMGGRGAWFMASRHPDLFTAAIPMASSIGDEPLERLGSMPTYVIHSRDDEVVPFEPAQRIARELERLGRPVRFEGLAGLRHFEMVSYSDALRRAGRWVSDQWKRR